MTVICWRCKREIKDYEFVHIDSDIMPVCRGGCVTQLIIEEKEFAIMRVFTDDDQTTLGGWIK